MGVFDKIKEILFDEEVVKTDEPQEELPERKPKKVFKNNQGGIIDYNESSDDTIQKVEVPKEDKYETVSTLKFPVDMESDIPSRSSKYENKKVENKETVKINTPVKSDTISDDVDNSKSSVDAERKELELRAARLKAQEEALRKAKEDLQNQYNSRKNNSVYQAHDERLKGKESSRLKINTNPTSDSRKKYKVPPVISPVFGILDKNYDPKELEETRKQIIYSNSNNTSASERQYGPVSYNDQPLPSTNYFKKIDNKETLMDVLKDDNNEKKVVKREIENTTKITEIYNTKNNIKEDNTKKDNYNDIERHLSKNNFDDNQDDYKTTTYVDKDEDKKIEDMKPSVSIDDLINGSDDSDSVDMTPEPPKDTKENEDLDDTIETDLFNLIDSMYKDDDK